jgi:hypothetical protein
MVNLAVIPRFEAIGMGAVAIARVADQSLIGGGHPFLATQIQWSLGVVVEHREVMDCLGGDTDQIPHRQA